MVKRIVILKEDDALISASRETEFAIAEDTLRHDLEPNGFKFDYEYAPLPLEEASTVYNMRPAAEGFDYRELHRPKEYENVYLIRVDVENEEAFQRSIRSSKKVVQAFSDLELEMDSTPGTYCSPAPAVGDWKTVAEKLGVRDLDATGKNIRVAIVDSGIASDDHIKVTGGWSPPGVDGNPGEWPRNHGTMCAFDVLIAAPDAKILDYALLASPEPIHAMLLSDAIRCYRSLITLLRSEPGPLVVNNSWGVYNLAGDYPINHPGNYSANINHPFNEEVLKLIAAGADVLFSAGNCGDNCGHPNQQCGINNTGPGRSIHGAKALEDAITIAAITTDDRRLGYSAQGPGSISNRKPDLAAYSHFEGSGIVPANRGGDNGTSAACPVAAGVVAASREKVSNSTISPYQLKAIAQRTAIDLKKVGHDYDTGSGKINPKGLLDAIQST